MYHLCPDPVTPQAPSQGRTACDFTTATISLEVFFKPHCTCEEDIYLLHRKEELSYLIKFPPAILFHFANIVWWVGGGFGRRKLIHLPGIVGWLQQMGSLGSWPRIAWSRHAIRMFRDRNLGLISVLRNQIGSYTELNCSVAPLPMHLICVVLDLAEGDILLLCSRPCSFAYQIGKALMVWVTLNDRLFKQPLHPSMHTSGCHTTLISALEP